jgi:hypothetical protein
METAVCEAHRGQLEAGAPFTTAPEPGVIYMGEDLAPSLITWSTRETISHEEGFTLEMELDANGQPRSQSIWISEERAKELRDHLDMFWPRAED